jgi:CubicO group peptidase (beta-lactamase class C family)
VRFVYLIFILLILTRTYPQAVSQSAIEQLILASEKSHSSSVALAYRDQVLLNRTFEPVDSFAAGHSILKSIAALAVGRLIKEGKIRSVNEPVYSFYPEWKQGVKRKITIKHLLNHTSGIECEDPRDDYFNAKNVVRHALNANIISAPGSKFVYNSKAFLLLMGIIGKAGAKATNLYIEHAVLKPLEIRNFNCDFDSVGNVKGISTNAGELIKIGQLVLQNGMWKGNEIVSKRWIGQMLTPSQNLSKDCGLLWWLIPDTTHYIVDEKLLTEFKEAGVKQYIIDKFRLLKGDYINVNIPAEKLSALFGADWQALLDKELYPYVPGRTRRVHGSKIIGFKAEGYLGQYIVIYPSKGIVAARMVRETPSYRAATDEFMDFQKLVYELEFIK